MVSLYYFTYIDDARSNTNQMSDRDDQGLNEAVAELIEDVLHLAGRLSKAPCRLSWKASATEKTGA